jgi:hypothetical protein
MTDYDFMTLTHVMGLAKALKVDPEVFMTAVVEEAHNKQYGKEAVKAFEKVTEQS